jgi:uncharacterized membrane protein YuzA (DUF378 family)
MTLTPFQLRVVNSAVVNRTKSLLIAVAALNLIVGVVDSILVVNGRESMISAVTYQVVCWSLLTVLAGLARWGHELKARSEAQKAIGAAARSPLGR